MNDKDFEVNTGEVKNVCENCRYYISGRPCYLAHGWGYDDKGIAIICNRKEKILDNSKN